MKQLLSVMLALALLTTPALAVEPVPEGAITISAPHAVLMEKSTGTIIYEKASHERCPPASVTKVMTMLLAVEAIEAGTIGLDTVVTASETACSMGGSQIWLEPGEQMTVSEMLKCVAVVSANDCAVALAELISGSEEAFCQRMNQRAGELGMKDSHFTNCTGLHDDEQHYTSAYDIALMSRELIRHDLIKQYTTIWMDTIRNGAFGLSNTNRLIFGYEGATGLKTGFTSKAMYCLSATAERDGVEYIADSVQPMFVGDEYILGEKGALADLAYDISLPESVTAPVSQGQSLGSMTVRSGDTLLAQVDIVASAGVERLSLLRIYGRLLGVLIGMKME